MRIKNYKQKSLAVKIAAIGGIIALCGWLFAGFVQKEIGAFIFIIGWVVGASSFIIFFLSLVMKEQDEPNEN